MFSQKTNRVSSKSGFSLIELLVVIAVIAIIAAILFPVFGLVKEHSRQVTCMSQMQQIYQALRIYKEDHNQYPPTLLGYVELPNGVIYNGAGTPVPMASAIQKPLFKVSGGKYLRDSNLFMCPDTATNNPSLVTTAVFPTAPGVTAMGVVPNYNTPVNPAYFYKADTYDTGLQVDKNGNVVMAAGMPVTELHYSLSWTTAVGAGDAVNQLKYPDPPHDKTVVTWCTFHVAVAHSNTIPVLLLSGTCKPVPTDQFVTKGPLNFAP
jgi:prepilin-type N-terminal cleavage/methylation domain-containing protein